MIDARLVSNGLSFLGDTLVEILLVTFLLLTNVSELSIRAKNYTIIVWIFPIDCLDLFYLYIFCFIWSNFLLFFCSFWSKSSSFTKSAILLSLLLAKFGAKLSTVNFLNSYVVIYSSWLGFLLFFIYWFFWFSKFLCYNNFLTKLLVSVLWIALTFFNQFILLYYLPYLNQLE